MGQCGLRGVVPEKPSYVVYGGVEEGGLKDELRPAHFSINSVNFHVVVEVFLKCREVCLIGSTFVCQGGVKNKVFGLFEVNASEDETGNVFALPNDLLSQGELLGGDNGLFKRQEEDDVLFHSWKLLSYELELRVVWFLEDCSETAVGSVGSCDLGTRGRGTGQSSQCRCWGAL